MLRLVHFRPERNLWSIGSLSKRSFLSEGFIEPHFFAGFSGGRKSVFQECVRGKPYLVIIAAHLSITLVHGRDTGWQSYPSGYGLCSKEDKSFVYRQCSDRQRKKTVAAFAGDMETAHEKGCEFLSKYCTVQAKPADIVITTNGGAPMDQNVYQSVKADCSRSLCKRRCYSHYVRGTCGRNRRR